MFRGLPTPLPNWKSSESRGNSSSSAVLMLTRRFTREHNHGWRETTHNSRSESENTKQRSRREQATREENTCSCRTYTPLPWSPPPKASPSELPASRTASPPAVVPRRMPATQRDVNRSLSLTLLRNTIGRTFMAGGLLVRIGYCGYSLLLQCCSLLI